MTRGIRVIERSDPDYWIPRIQDANAKFEESTRKNLAAAIALGKRLLDAKAALPHGEFGRLFHDHANPADGALPFNSQWARRLMAIAANESIAKRHHDVVLPSDLNAVYELAALPAPELEKAIESGEVTPKTTRAEAKALRKKATEPENARPPSEPAKPKTWDEMEPLEQGALVQRAMLQVRALVLGFLEEHPGAKRFVVTELKSITSAIAGVRVQ